MVWVAIGQKDLIRAKLFPHDTPGISPQQSTSSKPNTKKYQAKIENKGLTSETSSQKPSVPQKKPAFRKKSMKFSSYRPLSDQQQMDKTQGPPAKLGPSPAETSNPLQNAKPSQQINRESGQTASPKVPVKKAESAKALPRKTGRSPSKDRYAGLPRFSDSELKLQAIAWAYEASQRLAVINNRIVREGDSVDGYSIVQIRSEDVIVNDGTESWRLEFSLAQ